MSVTKANEFLNNLFWYLISSIKLFLRKSKILILNILKKMIIKLFFSIELHIKKYTNTIKKPYQ
jgi:hypothetical protein